MFIKTFLGDKFSCKFEGMEIKKGLLDWEEKFKWKKKNK